MIKEIKGRLHIPLDSEGARVVDFASKEDYFVYLALTGNYNGLADEYERLTGLKISTRQYRAYRSRNKDAQRVICDTKLTDGSRLLDAIKGKINL